MLEILMIIEILNLLGEFPLIKLLININSINIKKLMIYTKYN